MKYAKGSENLNDSQAPIDLSKITNFVIIGLAVYLSFILARSIMENYSVNQEILGLKREISKIERDNQKLKNEIVYYNSDLFVEIEARAKLGYQKPGENVIILPKSKEEEKEIKLPAKTPKTPELPNYLEWWRLFFSKSG